MDSSSASVLLPSVLFARLFSLEASTIAGSLAVAFFSFIVTYCYIPTFDGIKAPFVGYSSWLEPAILVRRRFAKGAQEIIDEGYARFKNGIFKVSRTDRDVVVLSQKYVEELRNLGKERFSSVICLDRNFGGKYGFLTPLLYSSIASTALQTRITPQLGNMTDDLRDELVFSLETDMPECGDWTPVNVLPILSQILARISNRVFVGFPICRDENWLNAAIGFSQNVTLLSLAIRPLPPILRPFFAYPNPAYWKIKKCIQSGIDLLVPEIKRRRELEKAGAANENPRDLLQGIMDMATPGTPEYEPEDLAYRQLIMSLAAVHTTAAQGSQTMFNMCAYPEYIPELRQEVIDILREDKGKWNKHSLNKMKKMDSFLKETQRLHPPSLLGFHRSVEDPKGIKLHDGTLLPKGAHVSIATHSLTRDPDLIEDPSKFDGFRYYRLRQRSEEDANKHYFAMTDNTHLHFGHGKQACPGRFLASNELKIIFAYLLMRYDFRYAEGQTRPPCLNVDEFLFSDPNITILFKKREQEDGFLA